MVALASLQSQTGTPTVPWREVPAIICPYVPVTGSNAAFVRVGSAGTGGIEDLAFKTSRHGYQEFEIVVESVTVSDAPALIAPFVSLMAQVKSGFGRTMTHLPLVFGVSRQALYNWANGEIPKCQHHDRIEQLAAAAQVFMAAGFRPTALDLGRVVTKGKSFLQLVGEGADGAATAEKLIRVVTRGNAAKAQLAEIFGDRKPAKLESFDLGAPALDEDA